MGSLANQKGTRYCGAFVRRIRAAVRTVLNFDLEASVDFSKACVLVLDLLVEEGRINVLVASNVSRALSC